MNHRDEQLIKKIVQEIEIASSMMRGKSLEDFTNDEMLKRAVCMTVINIGELVKNVTDETRQKNSQIPWKRCNNIFSINMYKSPEGKETAAIPSDWTDLRHFLVDLINGYLRKRKVWILFYKDLGLTEA